MRILLPYFTRNNIEITDSVVIGGIERFAQLIYQNFDDVVPVHFTDEDRKRDNWYSSKDWRSMRRSHISRNPLCVDCLSRGLLRQADVVDHIVERKDDDSLRLDSQNLQSLCHKCHNSKTQDERRRRRDVDRED